MSNTPRAPEAALERRPDYSWMDAIEEVLDASIEDEEDLEATFEEFEIDVPLRYGEGAPFGRWRLDGTVSVSVDGMRRGLAEWLQYWSQRDEER
jgi:hypothetical protein